MPGIEFDFSDLASALERLRKNLDALDGQEVPLGDLFDAPFMLAHTQYNSFEEFLQADGFLVESAEDWRQIAEQDLDQHVASHTAFASWEDMKAAAGAEWATRRLES
jgi:hypothetical protein